MAKTLVLGVGNLLMGDEGAGVHAVRALEPMPIEADVVDGGTGGFHLLSYFEDYDPIIMIDATMDGRAPGTVSLLRPRFSSDFPRVLSAHDIGLRDLVETAALLRPLPEIYLITISVASVQPMQIELSPEVARALPQAAAMARDIAASAGLRHYS
jgi:hydrogenase maturation protease